jgi:hypothetical protein
LKLTLIFIVFTETATAKGTYRFNFIFPLPCLRCVHPLESDLACVDFYLSLLFIRGERWRIMAASSVLGWRSSVGRSGEGRSVGARPELDEAFAQEEINGRVSALALKLI